MRTSITLLPIHYREKIIMNNHQPLYGNLCSLFYDHQEGYASREEVAFYATFLSTHERNLEAMSGSGRLQIPLLQQGYTVDGVDASAHMLQRCQQRCSSLQVFPHLHEQRLENLQLPYTSYKTVFIAVGSFQLIFEKSLALQALQKLRAHMAHHATLLIDIFTPPSSTLYLKKIARIGNDQEIHFSLRSSANSEAQQIDALCSYELFVHGIPTQQENERMQFRWYTHDELVQLLHDAKFSLIAIHEKSFQPQQISRIVEARAS